MSRIGKTPLLNKGSPVYSIVEKARFESWLAEVVRGPEILKVERR